jgi:membrane-bound lytic murein transglycosylase B
MIEGAVRTMGRRRVLLVVQFWLLVGAIAALLCCQSASAQVPPALAPAERVASGGSLLDRVWNDAQRKGVSRDTFERAFADYTPDPEVLALNESQPEHVKSAGAYAALLVSSTRIANGQAQLAALAPLLAQIEARYGVDRHIVLAIWGIESAYGTSMGERNVIRSLATLAGGDTRQCSK